MSETQQKRPLPWLATYVVCAVLGGAFMVLWASFGPSAQPTASQLATVSFFVGPLLGIPLLLLVGAVLERSLSKALGAIAILGFGLFYGFGVGR